MAENASSIAAKITEIVERRWAEATHLEPRDMNEVFVYLAYPRAYRCFQSIRKLCDDPSSDGEDPLILTRALISLTLRSIWPVATGDARERELRGQRRAWYTLSEEEKRLNALAGPDNAEFLESVTDDLAELEEWFASKGLKPGELGDADIARKLGLEIFTTFSIIGSATTHHSQLAALGGFVGEVKPGDEFASITLRLPKPKSADNALLWAIAVYSVFLEQAEPTIRLGTAEEIERVVNPWVRERIAEYRAQHGRS